MRFQDHLIQPQLYPGLLDGVDAWVSTAFVWEGMTMRRGDLVYIRDSPVLVSAGVVADDQTFHILGYAGAFVDQVTDSAWSWRRGDLRLFKMQPLCVALPAAWHLDGELYVIIAF